MLGITVGFWRYLDCLKVSGPQALLKKRDLEKSGGDRDYAPARAPCRCHGATSAAEEMAVGSVPSICESHTQGHSSRVSYSGENGDHLSPAAGPT